MPRFRGHALACLLVVLPCLAVPVSAPAVLTDDVTLDGLDFPSNRANTASARYVGHTSGHCDAAGNGSFTFRLAGDAVVAGADGRFEESGTFTVATADGETRVTAFASAFTASSPRAPVVRGTRRLADGASGPAVCAGATDATRGVRIQLTAVTEVAFELETEPGDDREGLDRGPSSVVIADFAADASPNPYGGAGGLFDAVFTSDRDGDGRRLGNDNCPNVANVDQTDLDGDEVGDACDTDRDGDGDLNGADNCADVRNADQADRDRDGIGDACDPVDDTPLVVDTDLDRDQVLDAIDNCAGVANTDQADTDGDRRGDRCDADDDDDGVADGDDFCPLVADPTQRDSDGDGRGDLCDGVFDSSDGHATGGGFLGAGDARTHLSFSARSAGGKLTGAGQVRDGQRTIRLTTVTGLHRSGTRAVIVGTATIGAAETTYRLEVADGGEPGGEDTVELEVGGDRIAGTLAGGNLQVR